MCRVVYVFAPSAQDSLPVWFVSDEHHIHYGQHLACHGDDSFLMPMLPFNPFIELPHPRVVLSCRLGALAENPSGPLDCLSW